MPRRGPNHNRLLEHPDLKDWYENTSRGSTVTASVYLRRLGAFELMMKVGIVDLPKMEEKEIHRLLLRFVSAEEKKKRAGSYIASTVKAVRSWLAHNGVRVNLPLKITRATATPTLANERVPTQDELRAIFNAGSLQSRAAACLMAHTGIRPQVLGNFRGDDGLRLRDLPDLDARGDRVKFTKIPAMVIVRPELSKAGHRYFAFVGEEGCEYVIAYLNDRIRLGEGLTPDSDLIAPHRQWTTKGRGSKNFGSTDERISVTRVVRPRENQSTPIKKQYERKLFCTSTNIGDGIRQAIRKAGFQWRPYVLRAYFDTQTLQAESHGKIARDYRVFFMGHTGSMESRYTTHKGRLPEDLIEDLRSAYKRCADYLETRRSGVNTSDMEINVYKALLISKGYTEADLEGVTLSLKTVLELLQKSKSAQENEPRQKVVAIEELSSVIGHGWELVPGGMNGKVAVVQRVG